MKYAQQAGRGWGGPSNCENRPGEPCYPRDRAPSESLAADTMAWEAAAGREHRQWRPGLFSVVFLVDCVAQQLLVLSTRGHLLLFCLIEEILLPLLPKVLLHQMPVFQSLRGG